MVTRTAAVQLDHYVCGWQERKMIVLSSLWKSSL